MLFRSDKLDMEYVDTGAMYRAVGYKMSKENVNPESLNKYAGFLPKLK